MEWEDFRRSDNVEDRRNEQYAGDGGGIGGTGIGTGHLGLGAIVVLGLIGWALGIDPRLLIGGAEMLNNVPRRRDTLATATAATGHPSIADDRRAKRPDRPVRRRHSGADGRCLVGYLPAQKGIQYVPPKLVLFNGATNQVAAAPSSDGTVLLSRKIKKVYLDTSFFRDMKTKYGGGGDFAYAYVIAHEIGHHIQDQLGLLSKVQAAQVAPQQRKPMRYRCRPN